MVELLVLPFFQRALLVGLILGLLMAVLGVLVVLRRLTFFADAIGHSALTGIALGLLWSFNPFMTALFFTVLLAAGIAMARRYSRLPIDTLLGVLFPAAVSLGVILVRFSPGYQTDLIAFLFGDILTVNQGDIFVSLGLGVAVLAVLFALGKAFVTIAVDESLAQAEGVPVFWYELLLLVLLAAVIALSIKLVGIILVTAMLVIPAAASQNIAWSLSSMFVISSVVSIFSVIVGMILSALVNLPSGPTIVLTAAVLFMITLAARTVRQAA